MRDAVVTRKRIRIVETVRAENMTLIQGQLDAAVAMALLPGCSKLFQGPIVKTINSKNSERV